MKKQMLILSISVCFMVLTCSKESPEVTAYSLRMPSDTPAILRHELRTDQDFSTGYANGNIRSDRIHMCWKKLDDPSF
ncbi:hypothetical protein JW935_17555, partial [candidate division KSB1 bacterium]|nr:hypothetical protein [candidate division KSB1 bacterium]